MCLRVCAWFVTPGDRQMLVSDEFSGGRRRELVLVALPVRFVWIRF